MFFSLENSLFLVGKFFVSRWKIRCFAFEILCFALEINYYPLEILRFSRETMKTIVLLPMILYYYELELLCFVFEEQ